MRLLCLLHLHHWSESAYCGCIYTCVRRGCGAYRTEHWGHAR